jgi:putative colanic acid biosynthesis acetyltransferase WcaF
MNLSKFNNSSFSRGRSAITELVWLILQAVFVNCWLPGSRHRVFLLRLFGARIGQKVCIKPNVRVKFPWRLQIKDHCWIGEDVWIDNLAQVIIGCNCCLSQGVYICTGSHDWSQESFDLITRPVVLEDCVWLGAFSTVAPGVTIKKGAVLSLSSCAVQDLDGWCIYQGNPAQKIRERIIK